MRIWNPNTNSYEAYGSGADTNILLTPTSDTYINSTSSGTNFDSSTTLVIGSSWSSSSYMRRALFTFNVSSLVDKDVKTARLRLVREGGTGGAAGVVLRARQMLRAYNPTQVTWNVYSTGNNWGTAGAKNTTSDVSPEFYGHEVIENDTTLAEHLLDVTFLLRKRLSLGDTTTFRMIVGTDSSEGDNAISFYSLEASTAEYRPILIVDTK